MQPCNQNLLRLVGLVLAWWAASLPAGAQPSAERYNIVLIVADDLGRQDLGCYGNRFIETPHLDRLAQTGILFANGYAAAPLCSPSRASLLTGHNPARINLTEHLHGYAPPSPRQKLAPPVIEKALPPQLVTIAEALKPEGYATGHFGKWHLGGGASGPAAQGFDVAYGGGVEGLPQSFFYPFFQGQPYPDLLADTRQGDYLDDALTTKALAFMEQHRERPFFVQLNFYAPHVPIQGKPELVRKYAQKRPAGQPKQLPEDEYAAMVENIDQNVGRVVEFLARQRLDTRTLVIFTSDNGGLHVQEVPAFAKFTPPTTNAPLANGKGYLHEGGIRTPWLVWMPGVVKKPRVEQAIVSTDDLFKTCMDLAGSPATSPDGASFVPLLWGKKRAARSYFLHFPHYSPQRGAPGAVVRQGPMKLVEWYETGELALYDLAKDPGEATNLAAKRPRQVRKMNKALDNWRAQVGAKMPTPNPSYLGE
jgi:arylsulfatase A